MAKQLGDRSQRSVQADIDTVTAWAFRRNQDHPGGMPVQLTLTRNTLVLNEILMGALPDGKLLPVARFRLHEGRWHLDWARQNGTWIPYDDKHYLTLAIPMVLVDEDRDGVFWG